jgi:hypothetical protein
MPWVGFEPTVQASEDSARTRPLGYRDRPRYQIVLTEVFQWILSWVIPVQFAFPQAVSQSYTLILVFLFAPRFSIWFIPSMLSIEVLYEFIVFLFSRDSVVSIATGYGLDDRGFGVRVPLGSRIFSSPRCPDRLCGPPDLLSNGYRRLFPRE